MKTKITVTVMIYIIILGKLVEIIFPNMSIIAYLAYSVFAISSGIYLGTTLEKIFLDK